MKSFLLGLLVFACFTPTAHARYLTSPRGEFLSVGGDLGTRGLGLELSLVHLDKGGLWYGVALGGLSGHQAKNTHVFMGFEAGFSVVGVEAGVAMMNEGGARARVRGLLSGAVILPYIEYLDGAPSMAGGVLLKLPMPL
jgi:hypothetical protein